MTYSAPFPIHTKLPEPKLEKKSEIYQHPLGSIDRWYILNRHMGIWGGVCLVVPAADIVGLLGIGQRKTLSAVVRVAPFSVEQSV